MWLTFTLHLNDSLKVFTFDPRNLLANSDKITYLPKESRKLLQHHVMICPIACLLMLTLWIKIESCRKSREVHDLPFPGDETIIPQQNLAIKTNCWTASHPPSHWGQLRRRTVRFYSKNSSEALENPHAIRSHSQNSLYSLKSSINAFNGKWWMTHLQNPNACEFLKVAEFLIWLASLIIWYT